MPWLDTKLRIPPGGPYTLTMNRTNWKKKKVFVPGISYVVLHPVRVCGKVTDYEYYSLNIPRD